MNLLSLLQQSNNPYVIKQMNNDPLFQRAMKMGEGKSEEELRMIARNLANQRGIDIDKLNMLLSPIGFKL